MSKCLISLPKACRANAIKDVSPSLCCLTALSVSTGNSIVLVSLIGEAMRIQ